MSSCLVVMQPTFVPWAGYFNLLSQADDFVFLDDVQLEKQSWQTRNRLLFAGQTHWVVVPVRHKVSTQTIAETELLEAPQWRDKLARGFSLNYGKHAHYADALEILHAMIDQKEKNLAGFNEALIRFTANQLGIHPRMHRASDLTVAGKRSARLISFTRHFQSTEYLSPQGAADYLAEDRFVEHSAVPLRLQKYLPQPYPQKGAKEFVSHLSIIDVVANLGWKPAREYILNGVA